MSNELTPEQVKAAQAANQLGFSTHVVGCTNDAALADTLLKRANARLEAEVATDARRVKLAATILESLKG